MYPLRWANVPQVGKLCFIRCKTLNRMRIDVTARQVEM